MSNKFGFGATTIEPSSKNTDNSDEEEEKKKYETPAVGEWAREGTTFHYRSRADVAEIIPGGIYQFVMTMQGWFIEKKAEEFEFPFKVYHASDGIMDRIVKFWETNSGNLGVLMNGLRGAGKTMTAQLLANRLIKDHNLPVLVVSSPIPLGLLFDTIRQDMMVIFDEFEKSHDEKHQQALLSTIDGMSRNTHKRLIVYTTNTPDINENFKDRPSRIHYQFEFNRVSDEVIEGLIDDSLPIELMHLKENILSFLSTRKICTIDIVKAVIAEVKTFCEPPQESVLNISKGEPPAYKILIVDPNTNEVLSVFHDYFSLRSYGEDDYDREPGKAELLFGGNSRAISKFHQFQDVQYNSYEGVYVVRLVEKCEEPGYWLAYLAVPKCKTPYDEHGDFTHGYKFFLDEKPSDWKPLKKGSDEMEEKWQKAINTNTVFGTGNKILFKIRIVENRVAKSYKMRTKDSLYGAD